VIAARRGAGTVTFTGELPDEAPAFVDADWIAGDAAQHLLLVPAGAPDAEAAAARAVVAAAAAACDALDGVPPERVEVHGDGVTAAAVRAGLGRAAAPEAQERPLACVVASPGADALVAATRRVADLGTVVVLSETADGTAALDLYPDVHLRSLTLIGIARPALNDSPATASGDQAGLPAPRNAPLGTPVAEASWYRVSAAGAG
jgi:hypothetical protein